MALNVTAKEIDLETACLAQAVYYEARGESLKGKIAVAHVVLNRTKSPNFPNSICKVTNQKGQFDYKAKSTKTLIFYELASEVIAGKYDSQNINALYFHNKTVKPHWNKQKLAIIGNHVFYK